MPYLTAKYAEGYAENTKKKLQDVFSLRTLRIPLHTLRLQ
jgi:hypothetical protein